MLMMAWCEGGGGGSNDSKVERGKRSVGDCFLKFSDGFRERDLARLTVCLTIVKFIGLSY